MQNRSRGWDVISGQKGCGNGVADGTDFVMRKAAGARTRTHT